MIECKPGATVDSRTYVRRVYTDAVGYRDSYAAIMNTPAIDTYEMIDRIDRQTGDRLRLLGAHADSNRFTKTKYLFQFHLIGSPTVPCEWLQSWDTIMTTATKDLQLQFVKPSTLALKNIGDALQGVGEGAINTLLLPALLAYIVLDSYKETKAEVRRRYS